MIKFYIDFYGIIYNLYNLYNLVFFPFGSSRPMPRERCAREHIARGSRPQLGAASAVRLCTALQLHWASPALLWALAHAPQLA